MCMYFIKLFHQRKQGIQTELLGKGKTGFIKVIELTLKIVNVEEDFLILTFGDEYLAYRKKVCRYIGKK